MVRSRQMKTESASTYNWLALSVRIQFSDGSMETADRYLVRSADHEPTELKRTVLSVVIHERMDVPYYLRKADPACCISGAPYTRP